MNIAITTEFRFSQLPDGSVWAPHTYGVSYWDRYLKVFDGVSVVARVNQVDSIPEGWVRSNSDAVSFVVLPYYVGLKGMVANAVSIRSILSEVIATHEAIIFRVPSQIATIATTIWQLRKIKYAVEVVGDPFDVFASGITNRGLDTLLQYTSICQLRSIVSRASAVSYVTADYLQSRYPAPPSVIQAEYSSIDLMSEDFSDHPRKYSATARSALFVGSLEQKYKGADLLITAIDKLKQQDIFLLLHLVGDGRLKSDLMRHAEQVNCSDRVIFHGELDKQQIKSLMRQVDMFVMPSLTEGLPRSMVEAMAMGLPCVGSRAGGITELLEEDHLVDIGDVSGLTDKLAWLMSSVDELESASQRNLSRSRYFAYERLSDIRTSFYQRYNLEMGRDGQQASVEQNVG